MIDSYIFKPNIDQSKHIIASYYVKSKDFLKAVKGIAIGQSIGNPDVRTQRDTPEIMEHNLAKILHSKQYFSLKTEGDVKIAYPLVNFNVPEDGVTQLLCTLMGGQMDIGIIESCILKDVELPQDYLQHFKGPKFGIEEIKKRAKSYNRPLLGGIIKPKTGLTISQLEKMVLELLEGGVDFIKEDEILGNPKFCDFKERVKRISYLVNDFSSKESREVFYAPCINGDYPYFLERAKFASESGAKAVHLNIWAGFPAYKALRDLEMPDTAIFFQKSGDRVITGNRNPYSIDWKVVCKLARMIGVDFIHAGMWGGYLLDPKEELTGVMNALRGKNEFKPTIPSLSCGSHPGLVHTTIKNFGTDLMMNVGGAIQGHPMGSIAGARAMRQAFDCYQEGKGIYEYAKDKPELKVAIEKWGYVSD